MLHIKVWLWAEKDMKRILRKIGIAIVFLLLIGGGWIWNIAFHAPSVNLLALPQELFDAGSPKGPKIKQTTFFDERTSDIRNALQVTFSGMILANLQGLLRAHRADATVFYAAESSLAAFRLMAQENLKTEGDYLLVNYQRSELGQNPTGHISPVAAYEADTDRFLILDVASYKFPPVKPGIRESV